MNKQLKICPFRGIIYNQKKIGELAKVITPPYDVISPLDQKLYYTSHPYNIIRIILGKEYPEDDGKENKYIRARRFFREWLSRGILKKEKKKAIYVYEKEYHLEGKIEKRRGFLALMKLEEFGSGVILPHEETFPKPGTDRFRLLKSCQANFSPIFSLYLDPSHLVDQYLAIKEPISEVIDTDGVKHMLGRIEDENTINEVCKAMENKKLFLADGHHRYLTALRFRDEERKRFPRLKNGRDFVMMYFLNMETDAISILPVHRLIGGLEPGKVSKLKSRMEDFFQIERLSLPSANSKIQGECIVKELQKKEKSSIFGMYWGENRYYLLSLKGEESSSSSLAHKRLKVLPNTEWEPSNEVNTVILDEILKKIVVKDKLEKGKEIDFVKDETEAIDLIKKGKYQLAFFLKALSLKQIKKVCLSGKKLPPKSTYFYPKPLSGLVMRDLDEEIYGKLLYIP
ncbi:DUF1015 domain-containing protein [Candidatus Aerophobetes bacterium]|uniref:DUF1015 domain-containing protein n=1 Tax=Aerophobetes bacterium TaxID=2030807 RepID=A0A523S3A0_UNCAE|nr:MAG: DUF1015 domain-containing protein [Candidatus Aerophobetes bacterium]